MPSRFNIRTPMRMAVTVAVTVMVVVVAVVEVMVMAVVQLVMVVVVRVAAAAVVMMVDDDSSRSGGGWWLVLTANDAHESSAGEFDRVPVERVLEPLLVVIKAQSRSVVHSTNVNHRVAGRQGVGVARADDSGAAPCRQHAQHRASKRLVAVELAIVRANLRCWG
jgi:hypothetical protein